MQLDDVKKAMKGVDIVQTTPFNKDGSLDLEGMRANTRWLLEHTAGKDFIYTPLGTTGEFYAMSDDECKAVIKLVVEEAKGKNVVLAGAARAGTLETIKMCQYAESVGADGVQLVLPYYLIPVEEGMYQHFKQIAESINIGIMIYNNPDPTGSWIKPALVAKLSKIPNIIANKESTPNIMSFYAIQKAIDPKDMAIFSGRGEQFFSFQAVHGCAGFVSGRSNFMPDESYSLYEAAAARDFDKVAEIATSRFSPYFGFNAKMTAKHGPDTGALGINGALGVGIAVIKAAMDIIGLRGGEVRLPLVNLTEEDKAELKNVLRTIRVIK